MKAYDGCLCSARDASKTMALINAPHFCLQCLHVGMIMPLGTAYLSYNYIYNGNISFQLTVAIRKQHLIRIDKYDFSTLA